MMSIQTFLRDDDMMSIASSMSISNLSTIGFLEDDEDEDPWYVRTCTYLYEHTLYMCVYGVYVHVYNVHCMYMYLQVMCPYVPIYVHVHVICDVGGS